MIAFKTFKSIVLLVVLGYLIEGAYPINAQYPPIAISGGPLVKMATDFQRPYIYAIQTPGSSATNGNLLFINTISNTIDKCLAIGTNPIDLTINYAENRLYIASYGESATFVVDLSTQTLEPPFNLGTNVSVINAVKAGRLITEGQDLIYGGQYSCPVNFVNTTNGTYVLPSGTYQFALIGDGEADSTGNFYYHCFKGETPAYIYKYQIGNDTLGLVAHNQLSNLYGDRNLILSHDGSTLFWMGFIFDTNLNIIGHIPAMIYACSSDGAVAFGSSQVFDSANTLAMYDLPIASSIMAVDRSDQRLWYYNSATNTIESLPLAIMQSPFVVQQPVNQTIYSGHSANISIVAAGRSPLTYLWYFNGTNFAVTASSQITISNFQDSDTGNYSVMVTNAFGSASSSNAMLTSTFVAPTITGQQPTDTNVAVGGNATFAIGTVDGSLPLNYQWQYNGMDIDGATNTWLNLTNLQLADEGIYNVIVTNAYGSTSSSNAFLNVVNASEALNETNFTWMPGGDAPWFAQTAVTHDGVAALQSGNITNGQQSLLQTTVTGPGTLTYWWNVSSASANDYLNFSINGVETARIFGVVTLGFYGWQQKTNYLEPGMQVLQWAYAKTDSNISVSGRDSGWLDQVSYTVGGTAPIIISQPIDQVANPMSNTTFSVSAQGTLPFNYQWFFNSNTIPGGTNSALSLPNVSTENNGDYLVVISNDYGSVTSQVAKLQVGFQPMVATQPTSQTNLAGDNVSFTVTVDGTGPFLYQWRYQGTNIPAIITTVAGNGSSAFSGDGGAATNASLYYPQGVGFDAAGNLYIADNNNNRVRKVDANKIITTVAGNGASAYAGDGGPATNASLYRPNNATFDQTGNLYIADIFNSRVRRVDTNGYITTVAGKIGGGSYSGDGGQATNANLYYPANVAFDTDGNWYIADLFNNRIRKVDTNGVISTVAGKSGSGFSGDGGAATNANLNSPQGVAVDSLGNLYIADTHNNRVRKVNTHGIITTIAGKGIQAFGGDGGQATNAYLNQPWFVTLNSIGDIYVADFGNNRIRKVDARGIITTVAGNIFTGYSGDGGVATSASLYGPACIAFDSVGNFYIADWYNNRIRKVNSESHPILTLTNVSTENSGNYSVVISSAYGSVTSAVATLTVVIPRTPPQIITDNPSFGFLTNRFGFNIKGAIGQTIAVDGSTNLINWVPLVTNVANGTPIYFSDPASTNFMLRYYRARLP